MSRPKRSDTTSPPVSSASTSTPASPTSPTPNGSGPLGLPSPSPSRSRISSITNTKALDVKQLNAILKPIPAEFFSREGFNPFNHWNDSKSDLSIWKARVEEAVEKIVDTYHKGFNTATSSFSHVLSAFSDSQKSVKKLQENMNESRRLLLSRNQNLKELWFQHETYVCVITILQKIAYVRQVPSLLDGYLRRKQYVHAVRLLQHTIDLLFGDDLREVDGLIELREEILTAKNTVQDQLVEELHTHVYAKNAALRDRRLLQLQEEQLLSAARRRSTRRGDERDDSYRQSESINMNHSRALPAHTRQNSDRPSEQGSGTAPRPSVRGSQRDEGTIIGSRTEDLPFSPFRPNADESESSPPLRHLQQLLNDETQESYLKHPEAHPAFLSLLIEALDHLNHLPSVKTQINKRVRSELQAIIQKETQQLKEKTMNTQTRRIPTKPLTPSIITSSGSEILVDLVERIFNVFTTVLKNHNDVIAMINTKLQSKGLQQQGSDNNLKKQQNMVNTDSASKFSIQSVWDVMQIELQIMLCDYLQTRNTKDRVHQPTKKNKDASLEELTFSFEDSSVMSIARASRGRTDIPVATLLSNPLTTQPSPEDLWIVPSPYNITSCYRPVVQFTDQASSMIGGFSQQPSTSSRESNLRQFLKIYIDTTFLPRVVADVNVRLDEILNDPSGFDARELSSRDSSLHPSHSFPSITFDLDTNSYLLMKSTMEVAQLLQKVFADMFLLPHSVTEYLELIETIVQRYLDKVGEKYADITKGIYAANRVTDSRVIAALEKDPTFIALREDTKLDLEALQQYFADGNVVYHPLFQRDLEVKKEQMIFDSKRIGQLALMCESLEWFAEKIYTMTDPFSNSAAAQKRRGDLSSWHRFGSRRNLLGSRTTHHSRISITSFLQRYHAEKKQSQKGNMNITVTDDKGAIKPASKSQLDSKRYSLAEMCQQWSDRCLFTMRIELHVHFFYFLKQMQMGSYWCATDILEPEGFILDLNKDLSVADEALQKYLPMEKKRYLFGGAFQLMTLILIRSLAMLQDKRVNKKGVNKLCRNLFALQQNLTNIITTQEGHFDKARQYFELLNLSDEDLQLWQLENPDTFTQSEYQVLLSIQTPARGQTDQLHIQRG